MKQKNIVFVCALAQFVCSVSIAGDKEDAFYLALEWMKTACVSGEQIEIKGDGEGGLKFFKPGAQGEFSFSKSEIKGVLTHANEKIRAEQNSEIRLCMQPHIQTILNIIANPVAQNIRNESLPKDQWLPVDYPLNIIVQSSIRSHISAI
jgi:hypothetical protein